jgi:hypothetical protein
VDECVFERASKISSVLERRRENFRGVRRGVFEGAEGKIEMWRGLFCSVLEKRLGHWVDGRRERYVFADYA